MKYTGLRTSIVFSTSLPVHFRKLYLKKNILRHYFFIGSRRSDRILVLPKIMKYFKVLDYPTNFSKISKRSAGQTKTCKKSAIATKHEYVEIY